MFFGKNLVYGLYRSENRRIKLPILTRFLNRFQALEPISCGGHAMGMAYVIIFLFLNKSLTNSQIP